MRPAVFFLASLAVPLTVSCNCAPGSSGHDAGDDGGASAVDGGDAGEAPTFDGGSGWHIKQINFSPTGAPADDQSREVAIAAQGRFVVFTTEATNLVEGDTNGVSDVLLYDREGNGVLERVSLGEAGVQGNGPSESAHVSADGRFVVFESMASNLVPGDTNGMADVFVRDRQSGTTERVSVASSGAQALGCPDLGNVMPDISADGRFVAWDSDCSSLVAEDTNGSFDAYVRDRANNTTVRVSVKADGGQATGSTGVGMMAVLSSDGRYVAFLSGASDLVAHDTNGQLDVYLRDLQAGTTELVSLASDGGQAIDGPAFDSLAVSTDGRFVSFLTRATNLFPDDTNDADDYVLRDRTAQTTEPLTLSATGSLATTRAGRAAMSSDARFFAFQSADPLTGQPTGGTDQTFLRDRVAQTLTLVSAPAGVTPDRAANYPAVAADGKVVAFESAATNLVSPIVTNGKHNVFVATAPY